MPISTSIVWLENSDRHLAGDALTGFLQKNDLPATVIFTSEKYTAFLIERNTSVTRTRLEQIAETIFGAKASPSQFIVEPNGVLHSFANCTDPQLRYGSQERTDWGVNLVWQSKKPKDYSNGHVAWVVDSGVSKGLSEELNVDERLNCTESGCPDDGQKTDRVGHGTMIAGIIGAKSGNSKGLVGVAPGATINSLRVVNESTGELNLTSVLQALAWLLANATAGDDGKTNTPSPGDVINLSLGAAWLPISKSQEEIETALRQLADKGLKISIAAGNSDILGGLAYVHAISPARAGGYGPTAKKGLIATASAFDRDTNFWPLSAFGNFYDYFEKDVHKQRPSLPSYAEPGAEILTLWPGPDLAICSGTSLAAAHLSGILLWGDVLSEGYGQDRSLSGKAEQARRV